MLVGALLTTGATFGAVVAWEYKCVDTNKTGKGQYSDRKDATYGYASYLETKFNALGKSLNQSGVNIYGWEMVGYGMNNGVK